VERSGISGVRERRGAGNLSVRVVMTRPYDGEGGNEWRLLQSSGHEGAAFGNVGGGCSGTACACWASRTE
jgi:hypothetical protein